MKLQHWYLPRRTQTVSRQRKDQPLRRLPLKPVLGDCLRGGKAEAQGQ